MQENIKKKANNIYRVVTGNIANKQDVSQQQMTNMLCSSFLAKNDDFNYIYNSNNITKIVKSMIYEFHRNYCRNVW